MKPLKDWLRNVDLGENFELAVFELIVPEL